MNPQFENVPKLRGLPSSLVRENAVEIEIESGVLIFRASKNTQQRIEGLLHENRISTLSESEKNELDLYEEIDDYLSFLNRLTRNLAENHSH